MVRDFFLLKILDVMVQTWDVSRTHSVGWGIDPGKDWSFVSPNGIALWTRRPETWQISGGLGFSGYPFSHHPFQIRNGWGPFSHIRNLAFHESIDTVDGSSQNHQNTIPAVGMVKALVNLWVFTTNWFADFVHQKQWPVDSVDFLDS